MATMYDYLKWRGDLTFRQDPPNEVDALIFSTLSYIHYGGAVEASPEVPVLLRDAAEDFFSRKDPEQYVRVEKDLDLLHQAAMSTRFGQIRIVMYRDMLIPEQETQFAAMTFLLDDGSAFLAFRGTDYTLVGWKEDFNMSFQQTVPAQRLAAQYLRDVAAEYGLPLRLGGHSKGGNLAVFAAARSGPLIQPRILGVFNNDGPGFTKYMMGDPGYLSIVPRIRTYVPQSSVIGMLLEHEEPYTVVKSRTVSLLQHDPYSWELLGREFVTVEEISEDSKFMDATIKAWFADMTNQERGRLVDVMFTLLGTGGVDNALEIFHPRNTLNYLKVLSTDENMRNVLSEEFRGLLEAARRTRMRFEETKELPEATKE
ncbi:MAG: DUF2974 domain-containing protein [Oscillospiraceae bacterium]|nr:DUF2974 domain-containing protein [Oscillospiraceae bacterium]MBQ7130425.1 DUF2974 domain-containing protein [Oscillospiraceae bacterium]